MKNITTKWFTVYARYPDGRRTELLKFEDEKTATVYAKKCAAHDDGTMAFEVCKVEVCVVPAFTKEAK